VIILAGRKDRVTIYGINDALREKIKAMADSKGLSVSDYCRLAVLDKLEREGVR